VQGVSSEGDNHEGSRYQRARMSIAMIKKVRNWTMSRVT